MIKRTIEVSSGPAHLSVKYGQMLIKRKDAETASVPCEDVGVLIIDHPAVTYTHNLLTTLLDNKAAVVICGTDHLPQGMLLPFSANLVQAERLRLQMDMSLPTKKRLWKQIVRVKIKHQAKLLGDDDPAYRKLMTLAAAVKSADKSNVEAQAARVYWQRLFPDEEFRRTREGDSPNNLLNYGYAILRSAVARAICASGLHPSVGLHHHNRYNPYCLADDLMEPFRPMVDARVRMLWREGKSEIDRDTKAGLLALLTDTVQLGETTGPFMVALPRMTASLCRCYEGTQQRLEIPEPCSFPDTDTCG